MVERMNQTLAGKLKCMAAANQWDWDEHLPYALFAYATTVHTSTGQTPFLMMFGRESRLPTDPLFGVPPPQWEEGSRPVEHLMETPRGARVRAYPQGEAAHQRQEQGARPRIQPPFYSAGSKPAGTQDRREPLEWRSRPPPEPRETEPPPPRPATRAGRVPRTLRRYLVGATQTRCSSQPGTGTGTSGGCVVPPQWSRSVEAVPTAVTPPPVPQISRHSPEAGALSDVRFLPSTQLWCRCSGAAPSVPCPPP
uniref:WAS/WASL-interacting protein family member 1-like n=1 Tax=Petromyzon marinus TaxID=7757 RepID=A0AAJ7T9F2_PETMA|nr:WAS/WASL-interacting protein family member 1-like [Petromyzon marinus]